MSARVLRFFGRFVAFSVPLFLLWETVLRQPYLTGLAHLFAGSARLFGREVQVMEVRDGNMTFVYAATAWQNRFGMTGINVVALAALVLATEDISWRRRLRRLGAALALLVPTQLLGLWTDIAHVHLHRHAGALPFADGLRAFMTGFGTFLFPLLIWLILMRDMPPFAPVTTASERADP